MAARAWPVELVAVADPELLRSRAEILGARLRIEPYRRDSKPAPSPSGRLLVEAVPLCKTVRAGQPELSNASYVIETLRRACAGCQNGEFAAMVTGPVHKGVINDAGIPFSGHTEFLADLTGARDVVMLLVAGELRVALVTTHLPLREVAGQVTAARVESVVTTVHNSLRISSVSPLRKLPCWVSIRMPGRSGHLGTEERDIIEPALARLRARGLPVSAAAGGRAFTRARALRSSTR